MIAIVETGGANIASIVNALARLGKEARLTRDREVIQSASQVILPGVGAAGIAMERIRSLELLSCLSELTQPVLGICLGMQLLFDSSEENDAACLGLLPGRVRRLEPGAGRPIPHMGWNRVSRRGDCPLFEGIPDESHFYFVHSFAAPDGPFVRSHCEYGETIPASVQYENFFGVQFHPERSGELGARMLANFIRL